MDSDKLHNAINSVCQCCPRVTQYGVKCISQWSNAVVVCVCSDRIYYICMTYMYPWSRSTQMGTKCLNAIICTACSSDIILHCYPKLLPTAILVLCLGQIITKYDRKSLCIRFKTSRINCRTLFHGWCHNLIYG
jgi:hypothetical protein